MLKVRAQVVRASGSTSALQELIMHAEMKRNTISAGVLTQDVGSCFTGSMRRRKHVVKACSGIVFIRTDPRSFLHLKTQIT